MCILYTNIKLQFQIVLQRTLEREVRGCGVLIIWTDCDREGENIGFEVIDVCKNSMLCMTLLFLPYFNMLAKTITMFSNRKGA